MTMNPKFQMYNTSKKSIRENTSVNSSKSSYNGNQVILTGANRHARSINESQRNAF